MPAKSQSNSEKIDRIDKQIKKLSKDVTGLKTDVSGLKTDVSGLKTDVSGLKTDTSDLKSQVALLAENQLRFDEKLENYMALTMKLYNNQDRRAEEEQEKNTKFRDMIYSLIDRVIGDYKNFEVEKLAVGAKQDRLETKQERMEAEIETLQDSDEKQNQVLANLAVRLEHVEAKER